MKERDEIDEIEVYGIKYKNFFEFRKAIMHELIHGEVIVRNGVVVDRKDIEEIRNQD